MKMGLRLKNVKPQIQYQKKFTKKKVAKNLNFRIQEKFSKREKNKQQKILQQYI